jgi:hypothetical protein
MKITEKIANKIDKLPKGYIFTYTDLMDEVDEKESVIKALNRMAQAGKIAKLSKGKYYKPEKTVFGNLQPEQKQVVKDLLEEDGKVTGYLTGLSIFNKLGLTTQVSNTIQIAKNQTRPRFKRERYTVSFIKQKNTITRENIPMLQILDAIRYVKKIPDASINQICKRFLAILKSLSPKEKTLLIRLAIKYPPVTRALLGAMLDQIGEKDITAPLFQSLNPITQYKIPGISKILSTSEKWNIV